MNEKQVIPPSQNSLQFLENSLQCIVQNQGAVEPVYRFLAAHQNELNVELLNELPTLVSVLLSYNVGNEESVVGLLCIFGSLLLQFPLGTPEINIELAITIYKQSLKVMTRRAMPIDWASTMMNMATAYSKRIRGDRAENIENAIDAYKQSLKVRTREEMPVEWALSMNNLAAAYSKRIKGDRAQNLEDAIDAYKQSLQVRTRKATPVDWALSMNNLATTYRSRIKGDRAQNLEDAIDIYKQVLQVLTRKATPVDWANTIVNLANAYSDRIRGDRAQNLENAISAHKQALQVITREDMPMKWATVMTNLAIAYFYRIRGDRAQNLEDAIDTYGEALQVMTREAMPVEWSAAMMSLANAYFYRIRGERTQNLEDAIDAYKQSLQVRTREAMPFDWATVMMNLANPYFYRKGDRAQNLEDAIDVCKQALQVMTREAMPVYWAITMNNLALAYLKRIRGDRAQNLEDAIDTCKQSLQVRTREAMPIDWAATLDNLATAYSTRIRGDQAQNLENAIDAYKQSLRVRTREAMPIDWATSMHNLASTYSTRIRGDRAQNLENAIDAYKQSLQVRTRETMPIDWATSMHNLAMVNHSRIKGDRAQNLENAIDAYEQALMVFQPTRLPNECRRTARLLGDLCADGQRWHKATTAYEKALKAAEILYQSSLSQDSQKSELLENRNLFRRAAYALSRAGDLERATVTLELGRARGLSETLERDRADLTALKVTATDIYEQYQQAAVALRQLEAEERALSANRTQSPVQSLSKLSQQSETAIQDMKAAISAIRKISGYENFLDRPSFRDIAAGVQSDQPLVYIAPTPNGSVALIIHQEPIANQTVVSSLWLDTLTDTVLSELIANSDEDIEGWFGTYKKLKIAYTNFGKAEDVLKAAKESKDDKTIIESQKALGEEQKALSEVQKAWLDQIDRVIRQLWNLVMNPVCDFLTELEVTQAVLIPTGLLGLLPLHAAWTVDATCPTGRRYAVDTIQFSYIPNAQSLQAARAIADRTPAHSLLAVDEPRPTTASELPNSGHEVQTAITASPNHTLLRHEQATRSAIQALLPQHTALHFSGHGFAQIDSPLDSGLVMANDEILTLRDLLNLRLPGLRLAILSACETGLPGTQLPDEVISLPTGLLQAGVAGVVASLWSVADISTMMLLIRFYDFWQGQNHSPTAALCQAQQWVRDTTNGEKLTYVQNLRQQPSPSTIPEPTVDYLYKALVLAPASDRDFAHPFHWAAFSYVGA